MGRVRRRGSWVAVLALLVATMVLVGPWGQDAQASLRERCSVISRASEARHAVVTGLGTPIAVIGDSYAQGLGLPRPADSWPARLPGRVVVDGFAGSGFSAGASPCGDRGYAGRVARALAEGPALVVLQGGLNDHDQTSADIVLGVRAALSALDGEGDPVRLVVVGPPTAPARAPAVRRVDALLASVAADAGATYVRALDWDLDYLPDGLHLTADGHRDFGDRVAAALPGLSR